MQQNWVSFLEALSAHWLYFASGVAYLFFVYLVGSMINYGLGGQNNESNDN
jgi:hypothetical protein